MTTAIIVAMMVMVFENQMVANAADNTTSTAYELCKSATTWEEFVDKFEDFQYERGDFLGMSLKDLPERISKASTFQGVCSYGAIKDEKLEEFADAMLYAISLYNSSDSNLKIFVQKKDFDGPYGQVDVTTEDRVLTHVGNVVTCYNKFYYENADQYFEKVNESWYDGRTMYATCGVAYWNPDRTLSKMEYVPLDEVAQLKDAQKIKIDRSFNGTILVLLCIDDTIIGWTDLDGLEQYEDANGMEYNR